MHPSSSHKKKKTPPRLGILESIQLPRPVDAPSAPPGVLHGRQRQRHELRSGRAGSGAPGSREVPCQAALGEGGVAGETGARTHL